MPKNKIQFQKGLSLPKFLNSYGTETQCEKALYVSAGQKDSFAQIVEVHIITSLKHGKFINVLYAKSKFR